MASLELNCIRVLMCFVNLFIPSAILTIFHFRSKRITDGTTATARQFIYGCDLRLNDSLDLDYDFTIRLAI